MTSENTNKYKTELEYIKRYIEQQGFTVEEDKIFETIVAIVTNYKEEMNKQ